MNQSALDALATRLAAHLDCTQDVACRQIMRFLLVRLKLERGEKSLRACWFPGRPIFLNRSGG